MKTVKVRIAVVLDEDGGWSANGWGGRGVPVPDNVQIISAVEFLAMPAAGRYWVNAELPIPEPTEIEGEVE